MHTGSMTALYVNSTALYYAYTYNIAIAPNLRVTIANELRDQVEMFQTLEYPKFLSTLLPVFMDILQNGSPVFQSNAPEQVKSMTFTVFNSY